MDRGAAPHVQNTRPKTDSAACEHRQSRSGRCGVHAGAGRMGAAVEGNERSEPEKDQVRDPACDSAKTASGGAHPLDARARTQAFAPGGKGKGESGVNDLPLIRCWLNPSF